MTLADRIAVMKGGRIQQYADAADVYDRPANLFVAGFVGSPAMNFLPGTVVRRRRRRARIAGRTTAARRLSLPVRARGGGQRSCSASGRSISAWPRTAPPGVQVEAP